MQSESPLILTIDQSTTGTKVIIYDTNAKEILSDIKPHGQITQQVGWLEHDPVEIMNNLLGLIEKSSKEVSTDLLNSINESKRWILVELNASE